MRHWIAEVPLPPRGADGSRTPETLAHVINEAFSLAGLAVRTVRGISLGISGPDVIVKQITLPLLDDSEVGPALRFEARKHLPFDLSAMNLDFQILGRFPSERKLEILLAAVSHDHMQRHLAPLNLLGLEPDVLDATPLALANALMYGTELETGAHLLLDMGEDFSHLVLYQRGQPFFSRRLDFGGRHLTDAIARGIRVPFSEAEEWKLAAGADEPGLRVDWDSSEMRAVLEAIRTVLVEELRRSIAFYRTQGTLPESLRISISGGSARLPGLAARMSELLGSPVSLLNPIQQILGQNSADASLSGPQFAQAFGLALRNQ